MLRTLLLLCSLLAGCVTNGGILRGTGEVTLPPSGWVLHCTEQPHPVECP